MPSRGKRLIVCLFMLIGVYMLQSRNPRSHSSSSMCPIVLEGQINAGTKPVRLVQEFGLRERNPISRRLPKGSVHRYNVTLEEGTFLHAWVDQDSVKGQEIDIALRVYDPEGGLVFEVDSPIDELGSEELFLLSDIPGSYRVDVVGSGKEGIYRIRVQTIRPATAVDRTHAQAARLFFHARKISREKPPQVDQAIQEYLEAGSLWCGVGNKRWQAHSLNRVEKMLVEFRPGDWKRILGLQARALSLFREVGDLRWTAKMLVATGITQRKLGELGQAESSYRQALEISVEHGYVNEQADALMILGNLLDQRGDHLGALDVFEEALKLWKLRGRTDNQIRTLSYMGIAHFALGKHHVADRRFREAESLMSEETPHSLRAEIFTRIAEMYGRRKEKEYLERAFVYTQRALFFRRKAKDLRGEAVSFSGMSLWYRKKNDLLRARDAQQQALAIFQRLSDLRSESTAHYNLGLILLDQNDPALALEHFGRGEELARRQEYTEGQALALYGKALAHRMRGNPIEARSSAEKALKLMDSGVNVTANNDFENPYLTARLGTYELLMDLLITSPPSYTPEKDKARAFEISEGARWRLLLDEISTEGRSRFLRQPDPVLRAEYTRVRTELEIAEQEWQRQHSEDSSTGKTSSKIAELIETLDTLETRLRRAEESDPSRSSPASLKEAQALLDADTILVEYFLSEGRSFLLLVTPTAMEVFELPERVIIETKAKQLSECLKLSNFEEKRKEAETLAQDLSHMLVDPMAAYLGTAKRILVVPDGAIHYVPFAFLPEPLPGPVSGQRKTGGAPLLIDRHEIVYEPSASVLKAIRSETAYRRPPSGFLALMADAVFSEDYERLKYSRAEAEQILKFVPKGQKVLKALGHDATRELALSEELGNFMYIHFATHGQNHPEQPALSGIVLSQRDRQGRWRLGDLRLQDIKKLDLPAELVVLSACSTADGAEIQGEGFVALPQGFMQAGAARVVVSLWDVRDESTARLMERFYKALLTEKQSPAKALRTAQLWMLRETKWKSPYYWAAFEIQGEWR